LNALERVFWAFWGRSTERHAVKAHHAVAFAAVPQTILNQDAGCYGFETDGASVASAVSK